MTSKDGPRTREDGATGAAGPGMGTGTDPTLTGSQIGADGLEPVALADGYGRRTEFVGRELFTLSTADMAGVRPRSSEVTVWRTRAGQYVMRRVHRYQIRHTRPTCSRAAGYVLVSARAGDTFPCRECGPAAPPAGAAGARSAGAGGELSSSSTQEPAPTTPAWGQADRIAITAYANAHLLLEGLADGKSNDFARRLLAGIAAADEAVRAAWQVNRIE